MSQAADTSFVIAPCCWGLQANGLTDLGLGSSEYKMKVSSQLLSNSDKNVLIIWILSKAEVIGDQH